MILLLYFLRYQVGHKKMSDDSDWGVEDTTEEKQEESTSVSIKTNEPG